MWLCLSILSWGICCVNWSWKSDFAYWITVMCLRYYEMGFLPMLKETADVSVPLWYEKFNLKGWEKEWCMAYFHSPHTGRYENDVLLCAGNDANRTAEKFLHNSIQFLLNPNGDCLCQEEAEMTETKREGSRLWWRKRGWRLSVKQWRNGERAAGSLKGTGRGGSGSLEKERKWTE